MQLDKLISILLGLSTKDPVPAAPADTGYTPWTRTVTLGRLMVGPDAGMTLDGVEEYLIYGATAPRSWSISARRMGRLSSGI